MSYLRQFTLTRPVTALTTATAAAPPSAELPRPRFPALDGIRGVAILSVLIYHLLPRPDVTSWPLRTVQLAGRLGWVGVDVFFVLSGFLITGILLDARDTPQRWRTFLARRALRIFPLYYGAVALLGLLLPHPQAWLGWLLAYGANVRMGLWPLFRGSESIPSAAWHFWSLAVEEQFYLLWPFVVWSVAPQRLARLCLGLAALALVVRLGLRASVGSHGAYLLLPARMDALVIGGLLAVALRTPDWWAAWQRVRGRAGGAAAAVVMLLIARVLLSPAPSADLSVDIGMQTLGYPALAIAAAAWIAYAVDRPDAGWGWLARGPLPWTGGYAYGLYVWHAILATLALPLLARRGWLGPSPDVRPWWGMAGHLVAGVALSVGAAVVSYHALEAPFLRLKRLAATGVRRGADAERIVPTGESAGRQSPGLHAFASDGVNAPVGRPPRGGASP